MKYTVYDNITGQVLYTIEGEGESITQNLKNTFYVEGSYNDKNHYIDINTKNIIDKPQKISNYYVWDHTSKTWVLDNTKLAESVRSKRNSLLAIVDKINPIWYNNLTENQQNELKQYRQALLDLPNQQQFPFSVIWPTRPNWL